MVADRRKTFSGSLLGPYVVTKIIRGPGLLVATAGNGEVSHKVKSALSGVIEEDALGAIQQCFLSANDGLPGHALILTAQGRIYEALSHGDLCEISKSASHWAIGSGYQISIGYLGATERKRRLTPKDAKEAIAFTSKLVNDVGDGCQTEWLR